MPQNLKQRLRKQKQRLREGLGEWLPEWEKRVEQLRGEAFRRSLLDPDSDLRQEAAQLINEALTVLKPYNRIHLAVTQAVDALNCALRHIKSGDSMLFCVLDLRVATGALNSLIAKQQKKVRRLH